MNNLIRSYRFFSPKRDNYLQKLTVEIIGNQQRNSKRNQMDLNFMTT